MTSNSRKLFLRVKYDVLFILAILLQLLPMLACLIVTNDFYVKFSVFK